ncbi:hypothetical protein A0U95_01015 [Pseudomonas brassicacearum]|nr:hypothetical protein A0U95_01015 [Pseudomonas brassicacearum]
MRKTFTTAAVLLCLAFWANVGAADERVVRIAVPDTSLGSKPSSTGLVDILTSQHLYEKALEGSNVKVQWVYFKGAGPAINEALANQQVDLAYLGDLPAIVGRAQGLDTQLISASRRNIPSYLAVQNNSDIKAVSDLKGRTIAVFRGTVMQLSLAQALEANGLSERDVKGVSLDLNAANAALASGNIDAAWGTSNLFALQEKGLAKVALSTRDHQNIGSYSAVLLGRRAFVSANADIIAKIKTAQQDAYNWLIQPDNKTTYLRTLVDTNGYPEKVVQEEFGGEKFSSIFAITLDDKFLSDLQERIKFAKKIRLIRSDFEVSGWM